MKPIVSSSCLRLFFLIFLLWFSRPILAADRNLSEADETSLYNMCERLLDADLSGYYVATNHSTNFSQLIHLGRLGETSAYVISTAGFELAPSGLRELNFTRSGEGWQLGDPGRKDARVNVLAIQREGDKLRFKFENTSDPVRFSYDASPADNRPAVRGDILSPSHLSLRFDTMFSADMTFTRVKLDRIFELVVSQSLKSLLAARLDPNKMGIDDYLITVQLKKPLMQDEAERLLETPVVYPLDEQSNGPYYRFATPKNIYELLMSIGTWTRLWQVASVDAVPMQMVNSEVLAHILERVKMSKAGQAAAKRTERLPRVGPVREPDQTPPERKALAKLESIAGKATLMPPQDLDETRRRKDKEPGGNGGGK